MSINLHIAGRNYPVKVKKSEEQAWVSMAEQINKKVNEFQLKYSNKDTQDCLAMTLLTYALDREKTETDLSSAHQITDRLSNMESLIDEYLN